jgi:hypothetical protein
MSGQSANLSLKEACAIQKKIQSGTHDTSHGGKAGQMQTTHGTKKK